VAILNPDIIITQGDKARDVIYAIKDNVFEERNPRDHLGEVKVIKVKKSDVLWIDTVHPNRHGLSNLERRKNWKTYSYLARDFMKNRKVD
jgi:hypothetical protein